MKNFDRRMSEQKAKQAQRVRGEASTYIRGLVWTLLEYPTSSRSAAIVAITLVGTILLSTVALILESEPSLSGEDYKAVWNTIESVCVTIFTIEFLARLAACPSLIDFVLGAMNWMDLIAILPFYIGLMTSAGDDDNTLSLFRVLRVARIIRIAKITRYSSAMQLVNDVLQVSSSAFIVLIYLLVIMIILLSTLVYIAEAEVDDDMYANGHDVVLAKNPFTSIVAAMWYVITTITQVGYGDMIPASSAGKMFGFLALWTGTLTAALPISIFSTQFTAVAAKIETKSKREEKLMRQVDMTVEALKDWLETRRRERKERQKLQSELLKRPLSFSFLVHEIYMMQSRSMDLVMTLDNCVIALSRKRGAVVDRELHSYAAMIAAHRERENAWQSATQAEFQEKQKMHERMQDRRRRKSVIQRQRMTYS